ncbi:MAG: J domain-containing protein [Candidatus Thiodiazotropha sp. (ex Troendleina suluensis)]|nr:J domain-containing protein [Candidatus Thiodiazotropha sp. (ex Troendleina suluensis)]
MDVLYALAVLFALAFIVSGLFLELLDMICELLGTLLGELLAKLVEALILLLEYLWIGLLAGSCYAARAILRWGPRLGRAVARCSNRAWQGLGAAAVFLYFLVDEAVRGTQPDAATEDDAHNETQQEDRYQAALQLLGLPSDCSREALGRAYKRAISRAHPDKGGTHEQAMAVNTARETIMSHNDWTR